MKNVGEILDLSLSSRAKSYNLQEFANLERKVRDFKLEIDTNQFTIQLSISDIIHSTVSSTKYNENRRSKRSVPYMAEMFKFVYGVATDEELQALNSRMSDLNLQNTGLIKHINTLLVYYNLTQQYINNIALKMDNFLIDSSQFRLEELMNYYRTLYLLQVTGMHLEKLIYPLDIENVHKFYSAAQVTKINDKQDSLRLLISIPLKTLSSNYHVFQLDELPHHVQNSHLAAYYELNHKNIAISQDTQHYILLDDSNLEKCVGNSPIICPVDTAVINTKIYSCALSILLNDTHSISQKCQIKMRTKNLPYFKRLTHNQHSWLYSTREKQLGVIFCPSLRKVQSYELKGTGLLELKPGCFFNSDTYILHPLTTHSFQYTRESNEIILQNLISYQDFNNDINKIFQKHNASFQDMLVQINQNISDSEPINLQTILQDLDSIRLNIYLQELKYWLHKFKFSLKLGGVLFATISILIIFLKFNIFSTLWKPVTFIISMFCHKKPNARQE